MNIDQLFEKYGTSILKIAQQKASRLTRHPALADVDPEDIRHELLLELVCKWATYNPDLASPLTFVVRVYDSRAKSLIRAEVAAKRDYRRKDQSLNVMVQDADGRCVERTQTINSQATTAHTGQDRRTDEEHVELRHDTAVVLDKLSEDAALAGELLKEKSELAGASSIGKSRRAFHKDVEEVRRAYHKGDMDAYL